MGDCPSVEGEVVFQGMKVGSKRMGFLSVLQVLGSYSEVISISADFDR